MIKENIELILKGKKQLSFIQEPKVSKKKCYLVQLLMFMARK